MGKVPPPLCASDASLWFSAIPAERAYAATLCLDCPFAVDCRNKARQRGEVEGVWGAETPEERRAWLLAHGREPGVSPAITDRDILVIRLRSALRAGKTLKEIAEQFGVSTRTVERKIESVRELMPVKPCDICGRALPTKYQATTKLCDSCFHRYHKNRFNPKYQRRSQRGGETV